jgi:hypothetical protein
VLAVDTIPLQTFPIANFRCRLMPYDHFKSAIGIWQSKMSFGFFMISVFAATATKLTKLKPVRRGLLVLSRYVVAAFAFVTLKDNVIAWHNSFPISDCHLPIANQPFNRQSAINNRQCSYSITSEMVPAPTVRPPSRIAKRSPFSIAIGVINSTSIATLSPGITISTPCGSVATPVTSVVRK